MPMLEVHGLVKIYGTRRVVDGVDFEVHRGEIVGLLGPNGAGKTTSFRMTCGMIEPNAGQVQSAHVEAFAVVDQLRAIGRLAGHARIVAGCVQTSGSAGR